MIEWTKTSDKLPERGTWVKVKSKVFSNIIENAVLMNTDRGTLEWLIAGIIHVALEEVTEWAALTEGDKECLK